MSPLIKSIWDAAAQHPDADLSWQSQVRFMNRFAELIVAECAKHAEDFNSNLHSLNHKEVRSHAHRVGEYIKDRMEVTKQWRLSTT